MAQISESSITLKLNTLSIKDGYNKVIEVEITTDEARELLNLLKEQFEPHASLNYPQVVRTSDNCGEPFPIRYTGINEDKNIATCEEKNT